MNEQLPFTLPFPPPDEDQAAGSRSVSRYYEMAGIQSTSILLGWSRQESRSLTFVTAAASSGRP